MAALGRAARGWARSQPCALALAAALAVCAFYYLGGGGETFSSATRRLRATPPAPAHRHPQRAGGGEPAGGGRDLHLLLMFTKAERSPALRSKAQTALRSLLRHGRLGGGEALHLHLVTDGPSRDIGLGLLRDLLHGAVFRHQVVVHDVNELTEKLFPIVEAMQKHFSAGSGTYYSDSIFFLSVAMHRIMPKEITQIIQVDLDLKYKTNIRDLFAEFDNFPEGAVIGIAREMQPVYSRVSSRAASSWLTRVMLIRNKTGFRREQEEWFEGWAVSCAAGWREAEPVKHQTALGSWLLQPPEDKHCEIAWAHLLAVSPGEPPDQSRGSPS
ncbi:xyloside xylosyltransferase 1 isoform X2 [Melanerpes formicivorus]|uniref:xyloside xylosyltransferase 1 isoform X2 n=1 Tax=Melanerpes formicivorus TaxID=211600 RepID=UPI00358F6064